MSDLSLLFARDPLSLTTEDIDTIIETMRKSRHSFNLGNTKAGSTKPLTAKQKELQSLGEKLTFKI